MQVDKDAFEHAITQINDGNIFEIFANDFLTAVLGYEFIPVGRTKDKGVDAFRHIFSRKENEKQTDPDKGIFKTTEEIKVGIKKYLKFDPQLLDDKISERLETLTNKPRRIKFHTKEKAYCLPYETRIEIEQRNLKDELLFKDFYAQTQDTIRKYFVDTDVRVRDVEVLITRVFNKIFTRQGLEFSNFVLKGDSQSVIEQNLQDLGSLKFAIVIDEAHSSQSGETSAKMNAVLANKDDEEAEDEDEPTLEDKINDLIESRRMIQNGSYFAFTATPKNKTLETFGVPQPPITTPEGDVKIPYLAFHLYSMKQAIEEEFILDVLDHYTTVKSFYKLVSSAEGNPEFDTREAQKKLRAYVEGHEYAIAEKAKIMIDHFHRDVRHLINNQAKVMVVTKSIISAIKYKHAFDKYLTEIKSPYKAIVAFSGKKEYKGVEYSETEMNSFKAYKNDIPKHFKKDEYRFLIVANKYQTGFDQPLLHTMYVDKKLRDVMAVQTLSRLNRAYKPFKRDTFVLDFYNATEDIKKAFDPYYTSTVLSEETNPNKLNELVDKLEKYEVFYEHQVTEFFEKYASGVERNQLDPLLDSSAFTFTNELNIDKQIDFKTKAKSFLRVYSYLTKIIDFTNPYYEQLWWFLKLLVPKLIIDKDDDLTAGLTESIDMDSYRPSKQGTEKITLAEEAGVVNPIPVDVSSGKPEAEFDTLENILKNFNQRFGDIDWTDKDKVNQILTQQIPADMKADLKVMDAITTSPDRQNAKISSDKKLEELMQQYLFTQTEIFKRFSTDKDFQRQYKEFIFDTLWKQQNQQPPANP